MTEQANEISKTESLLCPTCGTKVTENATRCVVCGTQFRKGSVGKSKKTRAQVTLSLPIAILLLVIFTLLSAGLTYGAVRLLPATEQPTPTPSPTITPTQTNTPEPTATSTPEPTFTPLPPTEYTVVEGDTCVVLAYYYNVSVRSIIELNNLGVECILPVGQTILIPQPTPTPTPQATQTLSPAEATDAACPKVNYTVEVNDTLSSISENYQVSMQAIKEYNGLPSDTVFDGQVLIIPLCERVSFGPTPTNTPPPPYPAPNLLLPQDGAAFTLANDTVTLQWASVGQLGENEYYQVTIVDITDGTGLRKIVDVVTDTKYIIPSNFRPTESTPHIIRWWVTTIRDLGITGSGEPQYVSAGAESNKRDFTWSGAAPPASPTP
jgi:LysM repeat protein